jgi:hypothetical protein
VSEFQRPTTAAAMMPFFMGKDKFFWDEIILFFEYNILCACRRDVCMIVTLCVVASLGASQLQ